MTDRGSSESLPRGHSRGGGGAPTASPAGRGRAEPPCCVPFGFVVDDRAPDKVAAGSPGEFAARLAERPIAAKAHLAQCPSCTALDEPLACLGLIETPLPTEAERWLVDRLPADIEGLPGFLLRKAIADLGYDGAGGRELRARGLLAAPGPFTRHFGPFFRRFTVSSEQLLEELLCAGDVDPPHALAILVHLGGIAVDGRVLFSLDEGGQLAELIEKLPERRTRTACTISRDDGVPPSVAPLARLLRALWAGFVVDAPVRIFAPEAPELEAR